MRVPGVDFQVVPSRVPMARVLELLGFEVRHRRGSQIHGPCPVHQSQSKRSRSFSVNIASGLCCCHKCGFAGNQIQLWAKTKGMTVYAAAIDLCKRAGVDVPWVERW
jgi:DNA primase